MFRRSLPAAAVFWLCSVAIPALAAPQASNNQPQTPQEQTPQTQPQQPAEKPDAFFAGTVTEMAADHISVARVVQGKTEKRMFRLVPETKVEGQGRLRLKVRVTVRYQSRDEGDTATMIVVRTPSKTKK